MTVSSASEVNYQDAGPSSGVGDMQNPSTVEEARGFVGKATVSIEDWVAQQLELAPAPGAMQRQELCRLFGIQLAA
ncbi:hypothetical protein GCM10010278_61660 [Streptomyces melanogenes]|nr:hypothetical protein GCM10010278_61660 [Streptomyces melanogenes]